MKTIRFYSILFLLIHIPLWAETGNIEINYFSSDQYRRDSSLIQNENPDPFVFTEGIDILCRDSGSSIYFSDKKIGLSFSSIDVQHPGFYRIKIENNQFKTEEFQVEVKKDKRTVVNVKLTPLSGTLKIDNVPDDAVILLNGNQAEGTIWQLKPGRVNIKVETPGYQTFEKTIILNAYEITKVQYNSMRIPFEITELSISRSSFNPSDPPPYNQVEIEIECSISGAWGILTISDESGHDFLYREIPELEKKNNPVIWQGLDETGLPLPEGNYIVQLSASDGKRDSEKSEIIRIDKNYSRISHALITGYPGNGLSPLPQILANGQFQFTSGMGIGDFLNESDQTTAAILTGFRIRFLPDMEWVLTASFPFDSEQYFSRTALSLTAKYLFIPELYGFSIAMGVGMNVDLSIEKPEYIYPETLNYQYSGISLTPIGSYKIGPLRFSFSPELSIMPFSQNENGYLGWTDTLHLWSLIQGGFQFEYGPVQTGISASRPFFRNENPYYKSEQGINLAWNCNYQFKDIPFSLSAVVLCEYYRTLSHFQFILNFSILNRGK